MKKNVNICVAGATGAVGATFLKVLEERKLPIGDVRFMASSRSKGKKIEFLGREVVVEDLAEASFKGVDIAFFSAGASRSKEFAPKAAADGAVVIDNSSAFRMDPEVPLVVPEVNPDAAKKHKGIIANPNCSTIQMVVALKPIADKAGIKRVVVSTYQSVSGAGATAIYQLEQEIKQLASHFSESDWEQEEAIAEVMKKIHAARAKENSFHAPITGNLIPQIGPFTDTLDTEEEVKMIKETKKIMGDDSIEVTATCIRVPVFWAHSEVVNVETKEPITTEEARSLLANAPGIKVIDEPNDKLYPMPLFAGDKDEVFVGRIRQDASVKNGLNMWIVADNLRKGAALNAVQIAEVLLWD